MPELTHRPVQGLRRQLAALELGAEKLAQAMLCLYADNFVATQERARPAIAVRSNLGLLLKPQDRSERSARTPLPKRLISAALAAAC